jgi:hypothetical protein
VKARPRKATARAAPKAIRKVPSPHSTAPRPLTPPPTPGTLTRTQDIESAYEAWQELREHHRAALARLNDERRKLSDQGDFVVGAVRAARGDGAPDALAMPGELDAFLGDAAKKLEAAKRELDVAAEASAKKWEATFAEVRAEVRARVDRTLAHVKPKVRLRLRTLAGDRRILHVDRVSPDEAVLLCRVFTGRLPSRYGFLFDDTTDDLAAAAPTLYAEEGNAEVRPEAYVVAALLDAPGEVLPLKAMLVLKAQSTLVRLIERGPVMEAEVADGAAFRNVLSREEAERIAGHLLKLKLDGLINLELVAD